jgi:DedD protein
MCAHRSFAALSALSITNHWNLHRMGLLSIFKRQANANSNAPSVGDSAPDEVQRARTRARQRLIGAVVLVGVGIIGFPLVFETQPRPIPVDIPIEVPHKDGAPPLVMPAGRSPAANSSASTAPIQPTVPSAPVANNKTPTPEVITEAPEPASPPVPQAAIASAAPPVAKAASKAAPNATAKAAAAAATEAAAKPAPESKVAAAASGDSTRAKALLEGKANAAAESGRFVVQVGAFADASAAREVRVKAEKLGMKTYTQVVSTSSGSRIRVRVGPFASRDEADSAMTKARSAGLTAVVLTL